MSRSPVLRLLFSILLAQVAGLVGAVFTTPNIGSWYALLTKPAWNPPNWLFGPVWTILYTMMGIAFFFAWTRHLGGKRRTLWIRLFLAHLVLNAAWSITFFGKHLLFPSLIVIGVLWTMILTLIVLAFRFDKRIAYLLVPYLTWVSFASYLNYSIWTLNR